MQTLTRDLPAVNPPAVVANWYTYPALPQPDDSASDGPDLAHKWGKEDGVEGNDMQGSAYFPIESPAWRSYNAGYAAGLVLRKALAQSSELDEIAFLELSLEVFGCKPQPAATLFDEIDEEWIGQDFSQNGWAY